MTPITQTPPPGSVSSAAGAGRLAAQIKQRWRDGEPPDAVAALTEHPELLAFKSVVVELAYEEYCLREQSDGAPEVGPFCARMPAFRGSIRKVVEAHRMLAEHPEVLTPEPMWPQPGDQIDGLEVVAELGRGTFARAYLAFDPQTDRGCVLKLSPGRGGEGRALGSLQHRHITDVYWADRIGGMTAVCMPLLGVTTLDDVRETVFLGDAVPQSADVLLGAVEPAPGAADVPSVVSADESYAAGVVAVAARIAEALAYLHRHNREHGDLKPSNVVLAPGGHPYLIDFNLAGEGEDAGVGGTVPYMAPERLAALVGGRAAVTDRAKADVYSFGVVLYELLTGRLPWSPNPRLGSVGAAAELLDRRRVGVAWPEASDVPVPVARLVEACLADAPAGRPAAADVAVALSRWLSAERGESTEPAPTKRRAVPRVWAAASAAALLLSVAGFLGSASQSPGGPTDAQQGDEQRHQRAVKLFNDGRRFLDQRNYSAAGGAFVQAYDSKPSLAAADHAVYSLLRTGNKEYRKQAIKIGERATVDGVQSPSLLNNLASGYIRNNEYENATSVLDRLLRVRAIPNAHYNRAYARFQQMLRSGAMEFSDLGPADDIVAVLAAPPESADFYGYAAQILAASSDLDPDRNLRALALNCLREAVRLGKYPASLRDERVLDYHFAQDDEFLRITRMTRVSNPPPPIDFHLIEPGQP